MIWYSTIAVCILLVSQASLIVGQRSFGTEEYEKDPSVNPIQEMKIRELCDKLGIKYGDLLSRYRKRRIKGMKTRRFAESTGAHDNIGFNLERSDSSTIRKVFSSNGKASRVSTGNRSLSNKNGKSRKTIKLNFAKLKSMLKLSSKQKSSEDLDRKKNRFVITKSKSIRSRLPMRKNYKNQITHKQKIEKPNKLISSKKKWKSISKFNNNNDKLLKKTRNFKIKVHRKNHKMFYPKRIKLNFGLLSRLAENSRSNKKQGQNKLRRRPIKEAPESRLKPEFSNVHKERNKSWRRIKIKVQKTGVKSELRNVHKDQNRSGRPINRKVEKTGVNSRFRNMHKDQNRSSRLINIKVQKTGVKSDFRNMHKDQNRSSRLLNIKVQKTGVKSDFRNMHKDQNRSSRPTNRKMEKTGVNSRFRNVHKDQNRSSRPINIKVQKTGVKSGFRNMHKDQNRSSSPSNRKMEKTGVNSRSRNMHKDQNRSSRPTNRKMEKTVVNSRFINVHKDQNRSSRPTNRKMEKTGVNSRSRNMHKDQNRSSRPINIKVEKTGVNSRFRNVHKDQNRSSRPINIKVQKTDVKFKLRNEKKLLQKFENIDSSLTEHVDKNIGPTRNTQSVRRTEQRKTHPKPTTTTTSTTTLPATTTTSPTTAPTTTLTLTTTTVAAAITTTPPPSTTYVLTQSEGNTEKNKNSRNFVQNFEVNHEKFPEQQQTKRIRPTLPNFSVSNTEQKNKIHLNLPDFPKPSTAQGKKVLLNFPKPSTGQENDIRLNLPDFPKPSTGQENKIRLNLPDFPKQSTGPENRIRLNLPDFSEPSLVRERLNLNLPDFPNLGSGNVNSESIVNASEHDALNILDTQLEDEILNQLRKTPAFIRATKENTPEADAKLKEIIDGILNNFGTMLPDNQSQSTSRDITTGQTNIQASLTEVQQKGNNISDSETEQTSVSVPNHFSTNPSKSGTDEGGPSDWMFIENELNGFFQ